MREHNKTIEERCKDKVEFRSSGFYHIKESIDRRDCEYCQHYQVPQPGVHLCLYFFRGQGGCK